MPDTATKSEESEAQETLSPEDIDMGAMYGSEGVEEDTEGLHEVPADDSTSEDETSQEEETPDEDDTQDDEDLEDQTEEESSEDEDVEDQTDEEEESDEDEEEEEEEEVRVIDAIAEAEGYEDIETEDLTDDLDGIRELTDRISERKAQSHLESVSEVDPELGEALRFIQAGGSLQEFADTYYNTTDYSSIDVEEASDQQKRDLVRDKLENVDNTEYSEEEINEILNDYEETGLLDKWAKRAKDKLSKIQEKRKNELVDQQEQQLEDRKEEIQNYWQEVQETVEESNQFAGIQIPESEKKDFFEFISEPVNEQGMSQRDMVIQEAPLEVSLAIDYMLYKDFNLSDIIERHAATKKAEDVESSLSKIRKQINGKTESTSESESNEGGAGEEIDLGRLTQ